MKNDLATSILAGIIGTLVAYFACNAILPEPTDVEFYSITSSPTYNLTDPNPELFNFRAINPTVEVYVGQCQEYNANGECVKTVEGGANTSNSTETPENSETPSETSPEETPPADSEEPDNETNVENIDGPTD